MPNFIAPRVCIDFDGTGNLVTWGRTPKGPKGPKGSRKPAKRSGKLKSVSGWHPATLRWHRTPDDVKRMDNAYMAWLQSERPALNVRAYIAQQRVDYAAHQARLMQHYVADERLAA